MLICNSRWLVWSLIWLFQLPTASGIGVPETNNVNVARMAVALSIVLKTNYSDRSDLFGDSLREAMTKAYIETYNAILENERQQGLAQ